MQPDTIASLKGAALPETATLRKYLAHALAWAFIGCLYLLLPLLPLLASVAYQRSKYVVQYWRTLKKMLIHIQALSEGPVLHYLQDVAGRQTDIPAEIRGECTQCGNCCLDKRCVFLEKTADEKYQCGIYHSPLRRFSNCGSFPLSAHDIERYACPGYTVVQEAPIHWVHPALISK
ncbi:MAG: hypothetical protein P4L83_00990 [Nevskia sp.]|nr:hypothetical protein [Nevskia sp.]